MAYSPQNPNWFPVTNKEAYEITCSTYKPGEVYSYETSKLPSPLQKLPGISKAYVSGYCTTYKEQNGVDVSGEIVAARLGEGTGKAYVYFYGVSGVSISCAGPYKPYHGHYYDPSDEVPIEKLFEQSPKPKAKGG